MTKKPVGVMTGADLIARIKAGPDIRFSEARSMFGTVVQCHYGDILLGNGANRKEAKEQGLKTLIDMATKLQAVGDEE